MVEIGCFLQQLLPGKEKKTISDKQTELDYAIICPLPMNSTFLYYSDVTSLLRRSSP
jgi:hypothetical protein